MQTISDLNSPSKKLLNFQEFTPAKIIVGCEINGWLQTKLKSPIIQQKRKQTKCLHTRIFADKKVKENIPPPITRFLQPQNNTNILSITKLKIQTQAFSTKCKTSQIKRGSVDHKHIKQIISVDVSAFEQGNNKVFQQKLQQNPVDKFFHLYQIQKGQQIKLNSGSITDRLQQRKRRISKILLFNKIRNESRNPSQNGNDFTKKISLINRSQDIVKGKLTTNQQRALNQIVKKGQFKLINNFGEGLIPKNEDKLNACRYKNKLHSYRFFSSDQQGNK